MKEKTAATKDKTTEEKIKEAARIVFYRKGFAATRTRDIAQQAGINLALLNYYFRSKQKLFEIIIMEVFSAFIKSMSVVLNDEKTSLEQKVHEIANRYIDLLVKEPEIPTFIVAEIRHNPTELLKKIPIKETVLKSNFFSQHQEAVQNGRITEPNPLHFLMNLMGLIIFPFIVQPLIMGAKDLEVEQFNQLMQERKKLIPKWVKAMIKAK